MDQSILVVGAGIAGLTAARGLVRDGFSVTVLDKGRAVGGRMATRRVGEAAFDHGAQHVSVRTPEFAEEIERLTGEGVARVWLRTRSLTNPDRGVEARYAGVGGMRRIPEALAVGLDVRTGVAVDRLDLTDGVVAHSREGPVASADLVVLTPPLPQTLALLDDSGVAVEGRLTDLADVDYDPTLAVMAVLDEPAGLPDGHIAPKEGPIAWMADNQHKGVSSTPAMTLHSTPEFARQHLEMEPSTWVPRLLDSARPLHSGRVIEAVGHRWRYSQPRSTRSDGALVLDDVPVVLAGEVFAGARVEGAFTSGVAARAAVRSRFG